MSKQPMSLNCNRNLVRMMGAVCLLWAFQSIVPMEARAAFTAFNLWVDADDNPTFATGTITAPVAVPPDMGGYMSVPLTGTNLTAVPAVGYVFNYWEVQSGSGVTLGISNSTTTVKCNPSIPDQTNVYIVAHFKPTPQAPMPLTVISTNNAGVNVGNPRPATWGTTNIAYGASVQVSVTSPYILPDVTERVIASSYVGTGSASSGVGANATSFIITQLSTLQWIWRSQHLLTIEVHGGGSVSRLPGGTEYVQNISWWFDQGSTVQLTATPTVPNKFVTWGGDIPASGSTIVGVTMTSNKTVSVTFTAEQPDSDNDGLSDKWERRYGLDYTQPNPGLGKLTDGGEGDSGPYGDPDNDGLPNLLEYQISNLLYTNPVVSATTNECSPVNADSDKDGIDDGYEYNNILIAGSTLPISMGFQTNGLAVIRPDSVYGPDGNPDSDCKWNPRTGYVNSNAMLTTDMEYKGPDAIVPATWSTPMAVSYTNGGGTYVISNVLRLVSNPVDSGDQSSSDSIDTEKDGFDDGFEYSWDEWQGQYQGDSTRDPLGHRIPQRFGIDPQPSAAVIGTVNSDPFHDMAVCNFGLNDVAVFMNANGFLTLMPTNFPVGAGPVALFMGRLNADGRTNDLVTVNQSGNSVSVMLYDPTNIYTTVTYPVGPSPVYAALGDYNGDGSIDIAVANSGNGTVSILTNNSAGAFADYDTLAGFGTPTGIAAGKIFSPMTNSLYMDLLVTDSAGSRVRVVQNTAGVLAQTASIPVDGGFQPVAIVIGDLDSDSTNDFAVTTRNSDINAVQTYKGQGAGAFAFNQRLWCGEKANPLHLAAGYLDQGMSNDLDLAVAATSNTTGRIFLGSANGSLTPTLANVDLPYPAVWVAIGDINRDRTNDLVFVCRSQGVVATFRGNGAGEVTAYSEFVTTSRTVDRRFNPRKKHVEEPDGGRADYDLIYKPTGGVGGWYTDTLEYHAWDIGLYSNLILRTEFPDLPRCTNPFLWDSDGDKMPDGWEIVFGHDPWNPITFGTTGDAGGNPDGDTYASKGALIHNEVYNSWYKSNDVTLAYHDFNPSYGWRGNGFNNQMEMLGGRTIAAVVPNDRDDHSTNPLLRDTDKDGMWDGWELYVGLNPTVAGDGGGDSDGDGLSNVQEFLCPSTLMGDGWTVSNGVATVSGVLTGTEVANIQANIAFLAGWKNKTAPTDPFDGDTDSDQIGDGGERGAFNYMGAVDAGVLIGTNSVAGIEGSQFLGSGLSPSSADTDGDFIPDYWELSFAGTVVATNGTMVGDGMNGTARDEFEDYDGDGLLNFQEYMTGAIPHWQYRNNNGEMLWVQGKGLYGYDPQDYFNERLSTSTTTPNGDNNVSYGGRRPKYWDPHFYLPLTEIPWNFLTAATPPKMPSWFSTTSPVSKDSDWDSMDDYWEVYHMLNPCRGVRDLVIEKIYGMKLVSESWDLDVQKYPWVNGEWEMDSDQDGLPNIYESLQDAATPPYYYHSDPSPYWMSDVSYEQSWANLYYWTGDFFGNEFSYYWFYMETVPQYLFDFEMNEGFDTDNDNIGDRAELIGNPTKLGKTDPLDSGDPIKRRALFLNGNAAARTYMHSLFGWDQMRTFTVEAWVRPSNPISGTEQVIVERPGFVINGNPMGYPSGVRLNFRLGLDPNGLPFIGYNGGGYDSLFVEAKSGSALALKANQWTHLAGVYDGEQGRLFLYVNGQMAATTPSGEIPFNGHYGPAPDSSLQDGNMYFQSLTPMPIIVGARDSNPSGIVNGSPILVTWLAGMGFSAPILDHYFAGWVDEIRIWSGVRSQSDVRGNLMRRYTMKDVTAINSNQMASAGTSSNQVSSAVLLYSYGFDDLPDPDHSGVAPAGFELLTGYPNFGTQYAAVNWWASAPDRSRVYNEYRYVPWIENLASHIPRNPPSDSTIAWGATNVTVYEEGYSVTNYTVFPNTCNPYTFQYRTMTDKIIEAHPFMTSSDGLYGDLLPLRWAVADEDVAMWDNGTVPALTPYDSDGDGLPDDWEMAYGLDPRSAAGVNGAEGDPDGDGLSNFYEYLTGNNPFSSDSNGNGVSDLDEDSDGDGLSNGIEINTYITNPGNPDTDDDGLSDSEELSREIVKAGSNRLTSPADSRSPLTPQSMVANGVALVLPARVDLFDTDRFDLKSWTIEAWVKLGSTNETGAVVQRILEDGRTNYALRLEGNCPEISFTSVAGVPYRARTSLPIPSNTWTYIAGSFNSDSRRLTLFTNGIAATSIYAADLCASGVGVASMGGGINGFIDEVRIWSVSRSDADIRYWYNKTYRDEAATISGIVTVTTNQTPSALLDGFLDGAVPPGITDLKAVVIGANLASGLFEGFPVLPKNMDRPPKGVILSSGSVTEAENQANISGDTSTSFGTPGDVDLSGIVGGDTYDAVSLIVTFRSDVSIKGVTFDFVFGSEEFPEFVGTEFNDDFGVFLDGENIAFDQYGQPVSVNNNFFQLNNDDWSGSMDATAGKTKVDLTFDYDGLTPLLTTSKSLSPGIHTLKFVIADTGDSILDSAVFLSKLRFTLETEGTMKALKSMRSYYMFDDDQNILHTNKISGMVKGYGAEDYMYTLDWDYALPGCVFSTTNEAAPLIEKKEDENQNGLPDWWEIVYFGTSVDPFADNDGDGLNNLYEYWAGTYPDVWDSDLDGFSDYDSRSGPGARTFGELYDDGDGIADTWENLYKDSCPSTGKRGLDPAYYDANLDPDEDGWDNYSEYMAQTSPLDVGEYPQPLMGFLIRYSGRLGSTLDAVNSASSNAVVKVTFYHSPSMDGYPDAVYNVDASLAASGAVSSVTSTGGGHVRQGNNYVFAYIDMDGNGQWNPTMEPAGIAQFQPVNLGWGAVNNVEIGLTDEMPGYPRYAWTAVPNVTRYVLTNVVHGFVKTINAPRNYWHEGDWLSVGTYGAKAGADVMLISSNAWPVGYFTTNVAMVATVSLVTPSIATPDGSMQFQYARNELEFRVDTNATNYRLQIAATSNGAPILSTTNIVPYMDINGVRKVALPFYAGDNYVPVGGNYASSTWVNGLYWARVQAATPSTTSAFSPWSSFLLNVHPPEAGGKSMISGDVYYFGKVAYGYGSGQSNKLTFIVQAFNSSGFSGVPDGQVQVTYTCNTNMPSAQKGAYSLVGLKNKAYYIRAFIDENGNRQLDPWEPMGFAQQLSANGYQAVATDLSGDSSMTKIGVRIVVRDRDTDDDGVPDGWEWMYYGTLANSASNIAANGMTLLRNYEIEPLDLDPTRTDYDADGVNDVDEITYSDFVVGRPPDISHYDPYSPVTNPQGTDLNPTKWDTDGDGLSDGYELDHGLNPINPADGAGEIARATAAGESIPGSPAVSQVATVTPDVGQFSLSWPGQIGMGYEVQYSDDLRTWQAAQNGYRYGAAAHTYVDQSPKVTRRFYRVVVR